MDSLTLLATATAAGLAVAARGRDLIIEVVDGSASAEVEVLVKQFRAHKPEVLSVLRRQRFTRDPRPGLAADALRWSRLLCLAYDRDGDDPAGLFGALHGLRIYGAALVAEGGRVRLDKGELDTEEYACLRQQYLVPHEVALVALLNAVDDTERVPAA